jgi:hypothetical protein
MLILKSKGCSMDSGKARQIFEKFAGTMAYVAVAAPDGRVAIGSAFHVGEGAFVTARHVVEDMEVTEVRMTHRTFVHLDGEEAANAKVFVRTEGRDSPVHYIDNGSLRIARGPYYHTKPEVDVAVFQVGGMDPKTPFVHLGDHLDDWLGASDFVLNEALVFGYPPIPGTNEPHLVAARCEVNALVEVRHAPHVHFILSATPRGGFSGGLVVTENGVALGVVTSSLVANAAVEELGFFAVLSVEPIYICLADNKLLPECQAEQWDDMWNSAKVGDFFDPSESVELGINIRASIESFDDGKRVYVEIRCADDLLLAKPVEAGEHAVSQFAPVRTVNAGVARLSSSRFQAQRGAEFIGDAAAAIERELCAEGLAPVRIGASRSYNVPPAQ